MGDVAVELLDYQPLPAPRRAAPAEPAPAPLRAPLLNPALGGLVLRSAVVAPVNGPTLQARVTVPAPNGVNVWLGGMGTNSAALPSLVGDSGRLYPAASLRAVSNTPAELRAEGLHVYPLTASFATPTEPARRVMFRMLERREPEKLFSFRMSDIPLPPEPGKLPHPVAPPRPNTDASGPPGRPFYDRDGGSVSSPVQVAGQPEPGGVLVIGLAPRAGAGWGAVRWMEVPVGSDGRARLESVHAGTYRVLRRFRPKTSLPAGGAWQGADARVEVAAGREAVLPALRWSSGAARR